MDFLSKDSWQKLVVHNIKHETDLTIRLQDVTIQKTTNQKKFVNINKLISWAALFYLILDWK
jgi:hypothetical protein